MASETSLTAPSGARVRTSAAMRSSLADVSQRLARLAFGATVVLSPMRAAIVLAVRPEPPVYSGYTDFTLPVSEIALVAALALWTVSLAARPRPVSLGPGFLRWPLLGLLLLVWLGVPFSQDAPLSAFNATQLLVVAALAVYALNEIDSLASLALPLGLMIGLQSIVGLGQLLAQRSIGLQWLGELTLDPRQNGVSVVAASGTERLLRAYGLTDHPNILAGLLVFSLLLVVGGARIRGRRSAAVTGTAVVLVLSLGLATLFATFSRAAWVAAAVGLTLGLAMVLLHRFEAAWSARPRLPRPGRGRLAVAAAISIVVILFLVPYGQFIGVRLGLDKAASVTEEMSIGERFELAGAAVSIAASKPLTGTGLGALPVAMVRADPGLTFEYQPAHVVVLDVAAEAGILAAICYLAVMVAPWFALWQARRRWTPELAAASAALAAVTVVGLFDYYTWTFMSGRIWFWLVLGLWAGAYARSHPEPWRPRDAA
jgi:O-antigen ligase